MNEEFNNILKKIKSVSLTKLFKNNKELLTTFILPLFSVLVAFYSVHANIKSQTEQSKAQLALKQYEISEKDRQTAYISFEESLFNTTRSCENYKLGFQIENFHESEIFSDLFHKYFALEPFLKRDTVKQMEQKITDFRYTCDTKEKSGSIYNKHDEIRNLVVNDMF